MKRTQETFKVVYSYVTSHDPADPNVVEVYLWALEGDYDDARRVFEKTNTHMNYTIIFLEPSNPPLGVKILEL